MINNENSNINFENNVLKMVGEFRMPYLNDYKDIKIYLWDLIKKIDTSMMLTIDISEVKYMNSSAQAILNMFVLELKRSINTKLKISIKGSSEFEWHQKFIDIFGKLCRGNITSYIDNEPYVCSSPFDNSCGWTAKK